MDHTTTQMKNNTRRGLTAKDLGKVRDKDETLDIVELYKCT